MRPLPELDGIEHRHADLRELRVHYAEAGEGEPVLLLHGWPQHHAMWAPVMAGLRERYRLLAPDLRGFGWSGAPGHGYDGETFASDQIELLDALGIERAHVIGHDWGGWTAFLLGMGHPERMSRLIACNTPHPWQGARIRALPQVWRTWYAVLNASALGPALHRRGRFVAGILERGNVGEPFTDVQVRAYADSYREPERAEAAKQLYRYYLRSFARGLRNEWDDERLEAPMLLLFGERDALVTVELVRDPRPYAERAPRMRVELVPDAGHFLVDERAQLVIKRAQTFLAADQ